MLVRGEIATAILVDLIKTHKGGKGWAIKDYISYAWLCS
jgi:hypothetical protein